MIVNNRYLLISKTPNQSYLDKLGQKTVFVDNLPSRFFVRKFLQRHPGFSLRSANPIKRSRAAVSRQDVDDFFTNFEQTVEGIPPTNIFNYDETNLRDDPGSKKCIFKKGTKYCEQVQNTSKQAEFILHM